MRKLLWMAALAIGCGGSAPSAPAIDNSRTISSLTKKEQMQYCAWQTGTLGGDGHMFECGPIETTLRVDTCLRQFGNLGPKCEVVTYGSLQACATLMSKDCSKITQSDDCLNVFTCVVLF